MPSRKVDTNSYEPSYAQLINIIQDQITSGEFRPGDRLPTESQLCAYHGLSPMTVHRAITALANEGIITTQRGKGIFVKPMQFWQTAFRLEQLEHLFSENKAAEITIIGLKIKPADAEVASRLDIKTGQKVIFLRRLISLKEQPFVCHHEYLLYDPKSPIIESEMEATSLKGLFEGKGNQHFKKSTLSIQAVILADDEARLLKAPVKSAAFHIEHVFYNYEDCPVCWGWFICPGDRMQFSTVAGMDSKA